MSFSIDIAGPSFGEDVALLALMHAAFAGMEGRIDPPSSLHRMTVQDVARKRQREVLILARSRAALIGCVFLARKADHAYLGKIAVAPDWQGKGVGRALVEAAVSHAERAIIRLETRIELVENHALFAALGFVEVARSAHPGYDRPTSLTMERRR